MSVNLFVAGTGTEVGKSYVTGLIIKKLNSLGCACGYFKATMSDSGEDAKRIKEVSGIAQDEATMCPYVYKTEALPYIAGRVENNPVSLDVIKDAFDKVGKDFDYITMEGSSGICCPISDELMLEDIVGTLGLHSIIVADAGVGCINSVVLTASYMIMRDMHVKGIILNHFVEGDENCEENLRMCELLTGVPVIAKVKDGDTDLDIDEDTLLMLYA